MQRKTIFGLTCVLTVVLSPILRENSSWAQGLEQTQNPQYVDIPIKGAGFLGRSLDMVSEVFKPAGDGPFPVMVYLHGRSGTQTERLGMTEAVPRDYLAYWLEKGFAVVGPMRPGYGKTGGADREYPGHRWEKDGSCTQPTFKSTITPARLAADAALAWVRQQPWVKPNAVIVSGNSVGGMVTVSIAASQPEGVVGYINFAGGIGGNPSLSPGKSCDPDQIRSLYSEYGASVKAPSLWLYAANDLFWGMEAPKGWHAAFAQGGSNTQLVSTDRLADKDGHDLIFFGRVLWHAPVDAYLKSLGF